MKQSALAVLMLVCSHHALAQELFAKCGEISGYDDYLEAGVFKNPYPLKMIKIENLVKEQPRGSSPAEYFYYTATEWVPGVCEWSPTRVDCGATGSKEIHKNWQVSFYRIDGGGSAECTFEHTEEELDAIAGEILPLIMGANRF